MRKGFQRDDISMDYIETQFQLADAVTFVKFRDVPGSTLNLVLKKDMEPEENISEEPTAQKQWKKFILLNF